MVRQNGVTLSGLIVGIVFGVAVLAMILSLIFMCLRSHLAAKKDKRMREAAMDAAAAGARGGAMKSEDHVPLMENQGPGGGMEDYNPMAMRQERRNLSPYRDVTARVPVPQRVPTPQRLHPGLMDVNQYSGDDEDIAYGRGR